ncbi:MAG: LacI family DNA-binding transcriptional regulator, partial [Verrucomicrobia bacterium]|nr:LacI family DNA-binding transcriptional regulator [Verrucomicrobiota bacterium]
RKITQIELARKAGVSQTAISLILNGESRASFSPQVRARVLGLVRKFNYVAARRSPGRRNQNLVGFLYPQRPCDFYEFEGAYGDILNGLQIAAQKKGTHIVVLESRLFEQAPALQAITRSIRGIIVESTDADLVRRLAANCPLVSIGCRPPGLAVNHVRRNTTAAAEAILGHLRDLGHQRVLLVREQPIGPYGAERRAAIQQLAAGYSIHVIGEAVLKEIRAPLVDLRRQFARLLGPKRNGPTAVICLVPGAAILQIIYSLGFQVPAHLSVVSFDPAPHAELCFPSLTSVHEHLELVATKAVEMLFEQIRTRNHIPQEAIIAPELIVRQSTSAPPAGH